MEFVYSTCNLDTTERYILNKSEIKNKSKQANEKYQLDSEKRKGIDLGLIDDLIDDFLDKNRHRLTTNRHNNKSVDEFLDFKTLEQTYLQLDNRPTSFLNASRNSFNEEDEDHFENDSSRMLDTKKSILKKQTPVDRIVKEKIDMYVHLKRMQKQFQEKTKGFTNNRLRLKF